MMEVKEKFNVTGRGMVYVVPYFENFESVIGTELELEGEMRKIKGAERNKCSSFFYGTDEEWEKRNVWLLVEEEI